jgi:cytochrome c oxidase cbb3-type subunit III
VSARRTLLMLVVALLGAAACERESREFRTPPGAAGAVADVTLTDLGPGGHRDPATGHSTEDNAYAISQGKHLYESFNCVGCHAHGGGGMGPPLMDAEWIYGDAPANIVATILEGRPNGMPAFRGKIPDDQVWQIAEYVRSLSGLVRADAASGRDDHMRVKEAEQERSDERPTTASLPKTAEQP